MIKFEIKDVYDTVLTLEKNQDKCELSITQAETQNIISIDQDEIDILITHLKKIKKEILKETYEQ